VATAASRRRQRVTLLTDRAQVGAALARASQWIKRRNATAPHVLPIARSAKDSPYLSAGPSWRRCSRRACHLASACPWMMVEGYVSPSIEAIAEAE
jgi:hypothetical protein